MPEVPSPTSGGKVPIGAYLVFILLAMMGCIFAMLLSDAFSS